MEQTFDDENDGISGYIRVNGFTETGNSQKYYKISGKVKTKWYWFKNKEYGIWFLTLFA